MVGINYPALIIGTVTSLLFLVLLAIVLIANPKNQVNKVFSFWLVVSFGWSLFTAFSAWNIDPHQEFLANYFLNILGIFPAVIGYFLFGLTFLNKPYKKWLWYAIPSYFLMAYLMATDAFTTVLAEPFPGGVGFHSRQQAGDFLPLVVGWGASFIFILLIYLIKDFFTIKDRIHLQKVVLVGAGIILDASYGAAFNLVPALWSFPLDIVGQLLAASILTYAILKYELVDVSTRLRNILIEIIFAALLAGIFLTILIFLQLFFQNNFIFWETLVLAVFFTSFSQPLKERVLRFVDLTFYRTRYDYRETINKFTRRVGEILKFQELADSIIGTVKETFGSKNVHLFVPYRGVFQTLGTEGKLILKKDSALITFLEKNEVVIDEDSLSKQFLVAPEIFQLKPKLIIPLNSRGELIGILVIEERLSGDFYSSEDKNLLFTLAQSSAIALKNALFYQEVVEQKKDIERLLAHEREVNESKDEFVSIASHYLRTPLTSIKGYLYLLQAKTLKEKDRKEYLTRVINEEKRLSTLVEDLVSISSLEHGTMTLFKSKVSLAAIIQKVMADFSTLAKEKKLTFTQKVAPDIEVEIDSQKLTHALSNLVDNAIKFTSLGKIVVRAENTKDLIKISVEDTGIGIDESQVGRIFEKFHRGTSVRTFDYAGSGLGLYITKLIVEAHGGRIEVVSKIGKGSTFTIVLPI